MYMIYIFHVQENYLWKNYSNNMQGSSHLAKTFSWLKDEVRENLGYFLWAYYLWKLLLFQKESSIIIPSGLKMTILETNIVYEFVCVWSLKCVLWMCILKASWINCEENICSFKLHLIKMMKISCLFMKAL